MCDWTFVTIDISLITIKFSGRLFPVNERATRTIKNLYVENERVIISL